MESNCFSPQSQYALPPSMPSSQLICWQADWLGMLNIKPFKDHRTAKERRKQTLQMHSRTRALSHFLLLRYQPLKSKGLCKTNKHLTGNPCFHLLTFPRFSLGFGEHSFKVQDHAAFHSSSSDCWCRHVHPSAAGRPVPFKGRGC